jgi:hypothetical protein
MLLSSRGTQATELLVIGHECSATRTRAPTQRTLNDKFKTPSGEHLSDPNQGAIRSVSIRAKDSSQALTSDRAASAMAWASIRKWARSASRRSLIPNPSVPNATIGPGTQLAIILGKVRT